MKRLIPAIVLLLALPAVAEESSDKVFMERHLLPRLSGQMRAVSPVHTLEADTTNFRQSSMFAWVQDEASHRAHRGVRKAFRDFMLEETALSQLVESVRFGGRGGGEPGRRDLRFGVRFSHGVPQAEMRLRSGSSRLRLGIGLQGDATLEYRPGDRFDARLVGGYDASNDRLRFAYRHQF